MTPKKWDVIVVGTGMGGGPVGLKLAQAGLSVLFLEKGLQPTLKGKFAEEFTGDSNNNLKKAGRLAEPIFDCTNINRKKIWPFIGSGVGGSSALYGMVLERFQEKDFSKWPITYQQIETYYDQAEKLFGVFRADTFSHPNNKELSVYFQTQGIGTYRLPLAHRVNLSCGQCQSFQCDQNCKNHSGNICIEEAVRKYKATLYTNCDVRKILRSTDKEVTGVRALMDDQELEFHANSVILAAGALNTPLLLADSGLGNESGLLGRNLMRHYVDLYAIKIDNHPEVNMTKELGIKISPEFTLQSFGRLPPAQVIASQFIRDIPVLKFIKLLLKPVLHFVTRKRLVLATIIEDEPKYENRVWKENGSICISYKIDEKGNQKIAASRKQVSHFIKKFGLLLIRSAEKNEMLAHVCGTAKMGVDPKTSVVGQDNKIHGFKNLYILDASFFPTSGGINPGLTIAANSLRVADNILKNIGKG